MPSLYPSLGTTPLLADPGRQARPFYGRAWRFDFARGDFVRDGSGRLEEVDGHTAWLQWCVATILTERATYPIFSPTYGSELQDALARGRALSQAEAERAISEALLVDPRTAAVRDVVMTRAGDEVRIACTVVPVVGRAEYLEVRISA